MAFQGDSIYWVEVEKVVPNPFQPRREFDESKLQELADSIRMYGVLQPLTVTRKEVQREDGTFYTEYELIAGERRLRASKIANVVQVPVIIRDGEDTEQEKLELAIIENLQREDLNAVDRALAFKQLAEQFELSHAEVAKKVGRSREYVSNSIRLLALPEHMLESLKRAEMMEGHARTLLMLTDRPEEQEVVFKEILLKKLSVREVERIVRKIATDKVRKRTPGDFDDELIEMEKRFTETLGTRVQIQKTDYGGKLTIDYFSVDDLESLLKRIREEEANTGLSQEEVLAKLAGHTPLDTTPVTTPSPEAQAVVAEAKAEVAVPEATAAAPEVEPAAEATEESPRPAPEAAAEATQSDDAPVAETAPVQEHVPPYTPQAESVVPDTNQVSASHADTPVAPAGAIEAAEPVPEAAPLIPEPAPEVTTPSTPEPAASEKPRSSLADALARAIGRPSSPAPEPASAPKTAPSTPNQSAAPAPIPQPKPVEASEPGDTSKKQPEGDQDEGDLYSIRNFTV